MNLGYQTNDLFVNYVWPIRLHCNKGTESWRRLGWKTCNRSAQECNGERNKGVTGGMEMQRVGKEVQRWHGFMVYYNVF